MSLLALLIPLLLALTGIQSSFSDQSFRGELHPLEVVQFTPLTFDSWRPYSNPSELVQVGMNKTQVLAIAGKPDHEGAVLGPRSGIGWYYMRTGFNSERALLKFSGDTLIRIEITPIQQ
jgi:hypothetical protein